MNSTEKLPLHARFWLLLGVAAVAVAGLFSLVLVIARTPQLSSIPLFKKLFHEALVVHVDLSVLVWFLCIAATLWSIEAARSRSFIVVPYLERAGFFSMAAGALLLALSPLDNSGEPLMSNYIPVISNPVFFIGLALIFCGTLLQVALVLSKRPRFERAEGVDYAIAYGSYTAALITLIALLCFVWSFKTMPGVLEGQQYYEILFWGGGHVLQFVNTQVLIVAWVWLAACCLPNFSPSKRLLSVVLSFGLFAAFISPFAYMRYSVESMEFREFFTNKMIAVGGIGAGIITLILIPKLIVAGKVLKEFRALKSSLIMSLVLFGYGGVLGLMISGQNVTIPAHYHGSIVGVTLAFMGLAYLLLPRFGYGAIAHTRTAYWQPIVYGAGQIMHISGLAWSGGYGVLRKTPGALEGGFTAAKAAMGLMGAGGAVAIIGGFMFVIAVYRSVKSPSQ